MPESETRTTERIVEHAVGGGTIRTSTDEVQRMMHGRAMVRARAVRSGIAGIYNLTGVTRALGFRHEDARGLDDQIAFYSSFDGAAEPIGLDYVGGDPTSHLACFATRVSAGMLATMIALVEPRNDVLSIVHSGESHPSIRNAVRIAGGRFSEVAGLEPGLAALSEHPPRIVVLTPITPQKRELPEPATQKLVIAAKRRGAIVIIDDAHAASRMALGQAPALRLGDVDLVLCSMDKHLRGPRAALIAGRQQVVQGVRTTMYELGLEAPFASYVGALRAMENYNPGEIRSAATMAGDLHSALQQQGMHQFYMAGPGVAIDEKDLLATVLNRAGTDAGQLTPIEASSLVAIHLIQSAGILTILGVGMPGASAALRFMMFPDGSRVGIERILSALDQSLSFASNHIRDVEFVRTYIQGDERSPRPSVLTPMAGSSRAAKS